MRECFLAPNVFPAIHNGTKISTRFQLTPVKLTLAYLNFTHFVFCHQSHMTALNMFSGCFQNRSTSHLFGFRLFLLKFFLEFGFCSKQSNVLFAEFCVNTLHFKKLVLARFALLLQLLELVLHCC